jgi:hypothetical protein
VVSQYEINVRHLISLFSIYGLLFFSLAWAQRDSAESPEVPPPPPVPLQIPTGGTRTRLIPLPIYATLPNEGSTYGFMPVFMIVEKQNQRTQSILAPSLSWNRIIRFTHTFRWYYYPDNISSLTLIPSFSSNVNRGLTAEYFRIPRTQGGWTKEYGLHIRRSLFFRFFGIGPETKEGNESSYTRVGGDAGARVGYNITPAFNIGARVILERNLAERKNVFFLPLTHERFPNAPGLSGATTLFEGLSIKYDTRDIREYSDNGFSTELLAGINQGLSGSSAFGRIQWDARGLWQQNSRFQFGSRAFASYTPGRNIPFYNQSSLGGSFRLRGFTEDRFIDKGAWTYEIEERILLLQTRIYGVTADWRIDPFITVGQVFEHSNQMFKHIQKAAGLGFRAFVRPNVLGRVDVAAGGEGLKVYVELGYPF